MHGEPAPAGHDGASGYKSRLGIRLFFLYAIVYAGFVIINTVNPRLMGAEMLGQTFAVVYGFGLIVFALILALAYNALCGKAEDRLEGPSSDTSEEVFE